MRDAQVTYGNNWKESDLFTSSSICAGDGEARDEGWWSRNGHHPGQAGTPSVRGAIVDSNQPAQPFNPCIYRSNSVLLADENIGIQAIDLEACVCRQGQDRDECVAMCTGHWVACQPEKEESSCSCPPAGSQHVSGATCTCTCVALRDPTEAVNVGVLLPMFSTEAAGYSELTWSPRGGVYQALQEINNKEDGVFDYLLPNTTLRASYRDSKCDAPTALSAALSLTQSAFQGDGVSAIIGAGCSEASSTAAQVAGGSNVPIISPSSNSPLLSEGRRYPYFVRTLPSSKFNAVAMVSILQELWSYTSTALVHSTDAYGSGLGNALADAAFVAGLTLSVTLRFSKDAVDFSTQHRALQQSAARVVVLVCQASDGSRFLRTAFEVGVGGEGYLWLGADSLVDSSVWEDPKLASDPVLREQVLKGFFSVLPNDHRQGSASYQAYLARRQQLLPESTGDSVACSLDTDDDGNDLWVQDHDGDPSTPLACAGHDGTLNTFGYDAVISLAHALHDLVEVQKRDRIVGSELLDTLIKRVRFEGVSGLVEFYDASADPERLGHGDRLVGFSFLLLNYVDQATGFAEAGLLSACSNGSTCS
eukprot:7376179-Prymnesium_polylepis.1